MNERLIKVAYCAGFFDGEGSILINVNKRNKKIKNLSLQVDISQVSISPLEVFTSLWGGNIHKNKQSGRLPIHKLRYSGLTAKAMLEEMLPFLVLKTEEVIVGLKFLSMLSTKKSPIDFEPRFAMRDKLQEIRKARRALVK